VTIEIAENIKVILQDEKNGCPVSRKEAMISNAHFIYSIYILVVEKDALFICHTRQKA